MHQSQLLFSSKFLFFSAFLLLCMSELENTTKVFVNANAGLAHVELKQTSNQTNTGGGDAVIIPPNTNETNPETTPEDSSVEIETDEDERFEARAELIVHIVLGLVMCGGAIFVVVWILFNCLCPNFVPEMVSTNCWEIDRSVRPVTPPRGTETPPQHDLIDFLRLGIERHEKVLAKREQQLLREEFRRGNFCESEL